MRCKIFSVSLESDQALGNERKMNDFLQTTSVKRIFASVANPPDGPVWSVLFFYESGAEATPEVAARPETTSESSTALSGEQVRSIVALKKWRADAAAQEGVPLYMVAQNKWLEDIVRMPVKSLDDLKKVRGLGDWRVQKYGSKIVEILSSVSAAKRSWPSSSSYAAGRE